MKLNAAIELQAVSLPAFNQVHPFVPRNQVNGYYQLIEQLAAYLNEITGFDATSFQPNSGAQGEYAGLLSIQAYHRANGQSIETLCLSRSLPMAQTLHQRLWQDVKLWLSDVLIMAILI